jgi:2'-5' RNA ligase
VRLFVAVWPEAWVVGTLSRLVPTEVVESIRWIPASDWHVTLAFLGSVPDEELEDLVDALALAAADSSPLTARLGPATQFLGPGVLCVPVAGVDELARRVLEVTAPFSRSPDRDRPYLGHLTLARAVGRRSLPRQVTGTAVAAEWPVGTFTLVRSTTGPRGASYDTRAVFALGVPGPSQDEHVFGNTVIDEHRLPDTPPP